MEIRNILSKDMILPDLRVNSKKQLLQELAEHAAKASGLSERIIFDTLLQRERLGSTGVGNGIAIPHGKLVYSGKIFGIFARLAKPIEYESLDDQNVDLVFLLIAPEGAGADHLKALSRIARIFHNSDATDRIRKCDDAEQIWRILNEQEISSAA